MSSRGLASSLMYAQLSKPKLCLLDRGPELAKNARGYLTEFLQHPKNLCNPESPNQAQIQIVTYFMASTNYRERLFPRLTHNFGTPDMMSYNWLFFYYLRSRHWYLLNRIRDGMFRLRLVFLPDSAISPATTFRSRASIAAPCPESVERPVKIQQCQEVRI